MDCCRSYILAIKDHAIDQSESKVGKIMLLRGEPAWTRVDLLKEGRHIENPLLQKRILKEQGACPHFVVETFLSGSDGPKDQTARYMTFFIFKGHLQCRAHQKCLHCFGPAGLLPFIWLVDF